jgi:hypothetical protein
VTQRRDRAVVDRHAHQCARIGRTAARRCPLLRAVARGARRSVSSSSASSRPLRHGRLSDSLTAMR